MNGSCHIEEFIDKTCLKLILLFFTDYTFLCLNHPSCLHDIDTQLINIIVFLSIDNSYLSYRITDSFLQILK